ncbi:MAG: high frequency lysogenization protein HflD [Gammaproteobacteria bacterium]|nr:high frequency lysogenization protein HflD [Gammaproteobacteria bacterium]
MINHSEENRIIALAGAFQAIDAVKQLAHFGNCETALIETALHSLFQTHPDNASDVFNGQQNVQQGLITFIRQFGNDNSKRDIEITRYAVNLLALEKRLYKNKSLQEQVFKGIEQAKEQAKFFSPTHENVIANLAGLYRDTISKLGPKIMINGQDGHLNQQYNANRVRMLLLAGIRACVLWRHCGGNRFQFIIGRKRMLDAANRVLEAIPDNPTSPPKNL